MNSYFEQSGFYGHPHQAAAGMMSTASHHDQTSAAAAAAYRGFPLSLGMSPYATHPLHQTRPQDSPYDASLSAACKQAYDASYPNTTTSKECSKSSSGTTADTNGYKDVWNTSAGAGAGQATGTPVRPSACTPDSRVSGYIDAAAGSPASRTGTAVGAGAAWNTNCTIGSAATQSTTTGLHQTNHTFYPWMAIAG